MASITGFRFHRGALAAAQRLPAPAVDGLLAPPASLVVVVEGVNDHENLGALFRNAAALGLDAVLLSPTCADPMYRRSVRVSMGHVLHVPWTWLAPWPAGLGQLKAAGYRLVALTPDPAEPSLDQLRGAGPDWLSGPVAVLVGAEGPGLSAAARQAADARARIPMAAGVDSLNVATAAAIAFHRLAEWRASARGR
jgi:tRNA G18 (ribose-2'-O)-methylase SpoU